MKMEIKFVTKKEILRRFTKEEIVDLLEIFLKKHFDDKIPKLIKLSDKELIIHKIYLLHEMLGKVRKENENKWKRNTYKV